jgi:hypothetical protein
MGISYAKVTSETGAYGSGTSAPIATDTALKVNNIDYSVDRGVLKDETTDEEYTTGVFGGALKVSGSFDATFRPTAMAPLLKSLLGTDSTPGTYLLDVPVPAVIQIGEKVGSSTIAKDFYGVGVKSCEFTFEAKEFVKTKWDWFASELKNSTYDTDLTYITEKPLVFWGASLQSGATAIPSKSLTLTINRNIDDENFVLGNFKINSLERNGLDDISGTLTVLESQFDEMEKAEYGVKDATSIAVTNPVYEGTLTITCLRQTGGAGAVFVIPVYYSVASTTMAAGETIEKTIEYAIVKSATPFSLTITAEA